LFPGLKNYFATVIGIDVSETMLRKGSESCPVEAEWVHGDGVSLKGVADNSVDYVLTFEVFQHIASEEVLVAYFDEMSRVLRPGCIFQAQMRKGSDSRKQALVRKLPPTAQRAVFFLLRALRKVGFKRAGNIPMTGTIETWLGTEIAPKRAMEIASNVGFVDLVIVDDTIHANEMGYWIAGRRL